MAAVGVFSSPATTFPGPLTTLHVPIPTAGAFPAKLPPAVHTEKSIPALDVVGASFTITLIVSVGTGSVQPSTASGVHR